MLVFNEWRRLVWWPGIAFVAAFAIVEIGQFDRAIANALFYDPRSGWLGAGAGNWWAREFLHQNGRWLPRSVAAAAGSGFLASFVIGALKPWRRELLYTFVGMALVIGIVGGLKELTNVDCPWDLADFGGSNPYVPLFADRPDNLKHAACFPAAHSSSGFALLAVFFALRLRAPRAARVAFYGALAVGVVFAFAQEARGAHFLSHDITSAGLAWLILVWVYSAMLAPKPARVSQPQPREGEGEHAARETSDHVSREAQP